MKIRSYVLIFAIASLFLATDLLAQTGAAKGRGRVKGTVTDQDGKPISDVTVRFSNDRLETSFDLKTNEKGEWTCIGVAGGNWNIDFTKPGYETKQISYIIQQTAYNKPVSTTMTRLVSSAPSASSAPAAGAQKKESDPARALIVEGSTLADNKDYAGAIAKYEQAMQMKPELYTMYGEIGDLYQRMGNPDKALEAYNKLLEKDPANADARTAAVVILFEKKDVAGAKKILESMDLNTASNANALYNIAVGFYNAQDTKEAIRYWERVVQLDPKMVDAYFQLGAAYLSVKDNDKSKQMFQKVIELDPGSENAKMAQEMLDTMK